MPRPHSTMRKVREILRLRWGEKMSLRDVAAALAMPHATVALYVRRALDAGLTWPLGDLDDDALERLLFTPTPVTPTREAPDYAYLQRELRHKGVTLQLLWDEYRENDPDGYGYSQFCKLYAQWRGRIDVVMRQDHLAGEKLFVDLGYRFDICPSFLRVYNSGNEMTCKPTAAPTASMLMPLRFPAQPQHNNCREWSGTVGDYPPL